MRHLNGIYTQRYNKRHCYDGQLFRGRYKSIVVESDSYALELVRYIHRNPLEAARLRRINILKTLCRKISFIMGIGNGIAMPGGFVNTGQLGQTLGMGAMMGITETGWTLGMIV